MTFPITTERLLIRPRADTDLEACYTMNMEPGTLDYVTFPRDGDWDDPIAHRAYIAETHASDMPGGMGYFTLTPLDNPTAFLGWVLLAPEDLDGPEIEIGWRLNHAARGQGFATEAAHAIVHHAFTNLDLPGVVADIYRTNAASIGVARKLGMRVRNDPARMTETYVLWELTRQMWAAQT